MKTRRLPLSGWVWLLGGWAGWPLWLPAQEAPQFTGVDRLTNNEIALTLSAPTGFSYRIDAARDPAGWNGLVTLPTNNTTALQLTDSAAPYLDARFYRASQLTGTNIVSGDHLATTNGDVIIHPLYHASLVLSWNGKTIYNDPDDDPAYEFTYQGLPKADLILVSHSHGDHFSATKIETLRGPNTRIIAPQTVYNGLSAPQKTNAIILNYGNSTNVMDLTIEAVYATNSNHLPLGFGNGYVLTIGGKRIYLSGDTGNIPQVRALTNLDVAFLCMNVPFTMTVTEATNAVRAFRPKVIYPYHYRDQSGTTANAALFRQQLGTDLGIEVRLRKWY